MPNGVTTPTKDWQETNNLIDSEKKPPIGGFFLHYQLLTKRNLAILAFMKHPCRSVYTYTNEQTSAFYEFGRTKKMGVPSER